MLNFDYEYAYKIFWALPQKTIFLLQANNEVVKILNINTIPLDNRFYQQLKFILGHLIPR